jgi:hypothetical protein
LYLTTIDVITVIQEVDHHHAGGASVHVVGHFLAFSIVAVMRFRNRSSSGAS